MLSVAQARHIQCFEHPDLLLVLVISAHQGLTPVNGSLPTPVPTKSEINKKHFMSKTLCNQSKIIFEQLV